MTASAYAAETDMFYAVNLFALAGGVVRSRHFPTSCQQTRFAACYIVSVVVVDVCLTIIACCGHQIHYEVQCISYESSILH